MNWGIIRALSLTVVLVTVCSITWASEYPIVLNPKSSRAGQTEKPKGIQWYRDVDKAWKVSKSEQRPILLYVTYKNCSHCRKMEGETYGKAEVASDITKSFVPAKLSGEDFPGLVQKLGISLYPTTLIITPDAERLDTISGYRSAQEMQRRMAAAVRSFETKKR